MKKRVVISLLIGLAVFASGCKSENTVAKVTTSSSISQAETSSASPAPKASSSALDDVISGLSASDIKLDLQKWIPEAGVKNAPDGGVYWQSTGTDSKTGIQMSYNVQGHSVSEITGATFSVINANANSSFGDFSKGFLGMCTTVPYTGNDTTVAREFVENNIANVSTENPAKTTIGGVDFLLSGGPQARTLQLSKSK